MATLQEVEAARPKLIDILTQVSVETGVDVSDIIGPKKRALYVKARSLFARKAREADYVLIDIGEALGGRSHSAVIDYLKDEEEEMDTAELKKRIKGLNKEERRALVAEIAETGTKEERDNLAQLFSDLESSRVADVETGGAVREAHREVLEAPAKKKPWTSDLDDI